MTALREHLRTMDPALFERIETSWEIARNEWIPTLKAESESHSGLPHLQSVEARMDRIAEECQPIWCRHSEAPFGFNALEVYLALAAALFHDIGRGVECSAPHGTESGRIIRAHWAKLGIVSERAAQELAPIVAFHTSKKKWQELGHESVVRVHPWGLIHSEAIAALLCLADELDTAYDRVVPAYMRGALTTSDVVELAQLEQSPYCTKGLWRDFVSDVDLDPGSRLIKTVVFGKKLPGGGAGSAPTTASIDRFHEEIKKLSRLSDFRPENYFYLFLEYLPESVGSQIVTQLSEHYQDVDQFDRIRRLEKLSLPEPAAKLQVSDLRFLVRNYQSWSRQPVDPHSPRRQMRRAYDALSHTVAAVRDYIKYAKDELETKKGTVEIKWSGKAKELVRESIRSHAVWKLRDYLRMTEHSRGDKDFSDKMLEAAGLASLDDTDAVLLEACRIVSGEDQAIPAQEEAREALKERLAEHMREYGEPFAQFLFDAYDLNRALSPGAVLTLAEAHRVAVAFMECLMDVDLSGAGTGFDPRRWESYQFEEFHTNLLLAFGVYLGIVRRLLKPKAERLYRAEALGKLEGASEAVQHLLAHYVPEIERVQRPVSRKAAIPEFQEKFKKRLEGFLQTNRSRGGKHSICRADLDYASSWIFMRWLTRDVSEKNDKLTRILPGLRKIEIPFEKWLIEYESHLFDCDWRLRLEPSLTTAFIKHLLSSARDLSTGIHQPKEEGIAWDSLAASVREPDMERVKTAAVRLSSLMRLYSEKTPEETPRAKPQLHFGDVLAAVLSGETSKTTLETSFSAWLLKAPPDDPAPLESLINSIKEKDEQDE